MRCIHPLQETRDTLTLKVHSSLSRLAGTPRQTEPRKLMKRHARLLSVCSCSSSTVIPMSLILAIFASRVRPRGSGCLDFISCNFSRKL